MKIESNEEEKLEMNENNKKARDENDEGSTPEYISNRCMTQAYKRNNYSSQFKGSSIIIFKRLN